jgi:hypothetical protein
MTMGANSSALGLDQRLVICILTHQNGPMKPVTPTHIRMAWLIAIVVDALQIGLFPITATLSTWFGAPLDIFAMVVLWRLLGWHWALTPSFIFEFLPIVELAPTWTLATWIIVRNRKAAILALTEANGPHDSSRRDC